MTFEDKGHDHHHDKSPVFELERPFHCRWYCCPCDICHQEIRVRSGKHPLGRVIEMCWCCHPTLHVEDAHGDLKYKLVGDNMCLRCCNCFYWFCRCCPEYVIEIKNPKTDKKEGKIKKKFAGVAKELFTDADNFKIHFPSDATPNERALLLGSVVLADYLYFERPPVEEVEDRK
jgi:hypothetical protein